jgi:hypothetical protein
MSRCLQHFDIYDIERVLIDIARRLNYNWQRVLKLTQTQYLGRAPFILLAQAKKQQTHFAALKGNAFIGTPPPRVKTNPN